MENTGFSFLRFRITIVISLYSVRIGVRDGGGEGAAAPQKITKSKSRANVQHKSGEEWEIKNPKSQKAPRSGQQRQSGNIRFTVGQYWLIIKRTGTNYVNFVVNLVMHGKGV